jgi:5-methylcytosine-specific restriction endonuclease McrA
MNTSGASEHARRRLWRLASASMLRSDRRAGFVSEGAWFWRRHRFHSGRVAAQRRIGSRALARAELLQREQPVALIEAEGRRWWWYRDRFYWEDDDLTAHDVVAFVAERDRRRRRRLEHAHAALQAERDGPPRREPIPRDVRLLVWRRDGGRCTECGGYFELQYDHVIPLAMGGATSVENLQLLCAGCNRDKGAAL